MSAPLILIELTGETTQKIGTVVSIGGLLMALAMAGAGWVTDRRKERFSAITTGMALQMFGFLTMVVAPLPLTVVLGYFLFTFGRGCDVVAQCALWSDVLRDRDLAVGAAAINSISHIGAFLMPFGFGAVRDATGSYTSGLALFPPLQALGIVLTFILWRRERERATAQFA
jgi:ACS family tartrate transporter-like MFS transporter